jgi:hypothetical protein
MSTPFQTLNEAAATVAAFTTAVRLGLLDRIDRGPADVAELARTCGASERGVRVVLAALEPGGFVERLPDGRYRPTSTGLASLHPILPLWENLPDAVRTGVPASDWDDHSTAGDVYPATVSLLTGLWGHLAAEVATALPRAGRVLDAGAGAAPWSIAVATADPGCRVTALDLPSVLPATRLAVSRAGLTERFEFTAGDIFETCLDPGAYDLIVLGQVCHLFDREACATLIGRLAAALSPGGTFAVVETLAGGPGAAVHELSLYLRTRRGSVHEPDAYRRWLTEAGLERVEVTELGSRLATALITARRGGSIG